jgi:subtilisin-like proprotein convertase family protein
MSRTKSRLTGRVFGWFDSKQPRWDSAPIPARFRGRQSLALVNLEDRTVPATITGTVFDDVNNNGTMQAGEVPQSGVTVFLDSNDNGTLEFGSITKHEQTAGLPLNITDNAVFTSTFNIPATGFVADVDVGVRITHTFTGDIEIFLISPAGTRVELTTRNGGTGDNFGDGTNYTVFDQSAATNITTGFAPFIGAFIPEGALNALVGEPIAGNWTLEVGDKATIDTGTLDAWYLDITAQDEPFRLTNASGNYTFTDLPGGTYIVRQAAAPSGFSLATPATGKHAQTLGANDTFTGNFGNRRAPATVYGRVHTDGNGNGIQDSGELGLTNVIVYNDVNNNSIHDTTTLSVPSTDVPVAINDLAVQSSTANVSGAMGAILDVNVNLNISHTAVGNLSVFLTSPAGTKIDLTSSNGFTGDNFTNTLFDDEASTAITSIGSAGNPYTGSFRPEQLLSSFDTQNPNGNWVLTVFDTTTGDTGSIDGWELQFTLSTESFGFSNNMGDYFVTGLPEGQARLRQANLPPLYAQVFPATNAPQLVTLAANDGVLDVNFGNDKAPIIVASAATISNVNVATSQPTYTISVTVTATPNGSVVFESLNDNDEFTISGPGYPTPVAATFVSSTPTGPANANNFILTYSVPAPVGGWDVVNITHNGTYLIEAAANQITNLNGLSTSSGTVGSFLVSLGKQFNVTNTLDDSNEGSLRHAIEQANANPNSEDFILFDSSLAGQTITLTAALPTIADSVRVQGPTGGATISGNNAFRIFNISNNATSTITANISNLTLTNASTTSTGGAIATGAGEQLTLTDVVIRDNSTTSTGAAISAASGTGGQIQLNRVTIQNNTSSGTGGAIIANTSVTLNILDSTLKSNRGSIGGAIDSSSGTITIRNSTLSSNVSTSTTTGGGAIRSSGSSVSIINSTISGNTSSQNGGGISITTVNTGNTFILRNSTVTANKAVFGGGINRQTSTLFAAGNFVIDSSIVAANTSTSTTPIPDLNFITLQQAIDGNRSLIGVSDVGNFVLNGTNNITGTLANAKNPGLAALSSNGGLTQTHALLPGSFAIDAGQDSNVPALTIDQRGSNRVAGTQIDIGSFERVPGTPAASLVTPVTNIDTNNAATQDPYFFFVTYDNDAPIDFSSISDSNEITVTRTQGGYTKTASFVSATPASGPSNSFTVKYSIPAPATPIVGWDGDDSDVYTFTAAAGSVTSGANSIVGGPLGTFTVTIPKTFVVSNNSPDKTVANSLPWAIVQANTSIGLDFIDFDESYFATSKTEIERTIVFTEVLQALTTKGGPIHVLGPTGAGSAPAIIDANDLGRHFDFSPLDTGADVRISNLTLRNASFSGVGGSVNVGDEFLTLTNVDFDNNTATSSGGSINIGSGGKLTMTGGSVSNGSAGSDAGAIALAGTGVSTISNVLVENNVSQGGGGAFYVNGGHTLTVNDSTITGNISNTTFDSGGAFYLTTTGTTLNVNRSTISGNQAVGNPDGGGAIYAFSGTINVTISNSTIVNNTAQNGGAIDADAAATLILTINSSTIADNVATTGVGGGININSGRTVTIDNSLIARNTAAGTPNDIQNAGTVNATFTGLSTAATGAGATNGTTVYDLNDMKLAATLEFNGATTTKTLAIGSDSNLVNVGNPAPAGLTTDQRGVGFARVVGTASDIGAFEVQNATPTVTGFVVNAGDAQRSRIVSVELTFSGNVNAVDFSDLNDIYFERTKVSSVATGVVGDKVASGPTADNHVTVSPVAGFPTKLLLTFDNIGATQINNNKVGVESGSLSDGYWQLFVNGTAASLTDDVNLRRLYGDVAPEVFFPPTGTVDGTDLTQFGNAFGANVLAFDFNNDSTVDGNDLTTFGNRFGNVL